MFNPKDFDQTQFVKSGAIFAKQDQVWLFWGSPQQRSERPEALSIKVREFHHSGEDLWLLYPYAMEITREQAQELFDGAATSVQWQPANFELFKKQFEWTKKAIAESALQKAVPYIFETGTAQANQVSLMSWIGCGLRQTSGFLYGLWEGEAGLIGLTPELLVQQKNGQVFATMALAGTTAIEDWESHPEQFENDPKENNEHEKVVEDIVEQLKPFGSVLVGERSVLTTPTLAHLYTPLELKASQPLSLDRVVARLHPTAALGGYPRMVSQPLLKKFDNLVPRAYFGAPLNFSFSQRQADVVVAIRMLCWQGQKLEIAAGCGVVEESDLQKEWGELELKRQSVKKIFGVQ